MKRREGMTLIEAMIAVAILAMVTLLVYSGLAQTMRNRARLEASTDRAHVIRVSMERMVREVSQAFISIHVNPNSAMIFSSTIFHGRREGGGSRLDFTSFSHRRLFRDAHESDQNELGYFLLEHRDEETRETHTSLVRRESRRIDEDPEEGGQLTILVEDVNEFELTYLDPLSIDWVEEWDSTGMETNRLPSQVMIRLVVPALLDPDEDEVYTTRAMIPIQYALNHAVYNP